MPGSQEWFPPSLKDWERLAFLPFRENREFGFNGFRPFNVHASTFRKEMPLVQGKRLRMYPTNILHSSIQAKRLEMYRFNIVGKKIKY